MSRGHLNLLMCISFSVSYLHFLSFLFGNAVDRNEFVSSIETFYYFDLDVPVVKFTVATFLGGNTFS